MAPVQKIKTYSRCNNSLVNNSVDAFNVLFANNMAKRLLAKPKTKKRYLIKQLPPRKKCESLLADDSLHISTEDTFDKLFKNPTKDPKSLPSIHISNDSNHSNEMSSSSSTPIRRRKRIKSISDSNSLQTLDKEKTNSFEKSHLKRFQQPSVDKIEDSLEVEKVERKLKTSLSYITIPTTTRTFNETSKLEVTTDYLSKTLKQKLTTHCSTPIAPFKQVKLTNQTISPIKVNSLLQQTFKEIENWDNEFPVTSNRSKNISKTKYYSLRSFFKDSQQRSIFSNMYEDSLKMPNILKTSRKHKFITVRRKNGFNSPNNRGLNSNTTKKNLTVSLESFTNFEIQNMSNYSRYKLKESFLSQLSLVNYVTKENIEKKLERKQSLKSSYIFNEEYEDDEFSKELSESATDPRISKELRIAIPRLSIGSESVSSSESSFENFYSKNINSHLSDVDDLDDSFKDCNKKEKDLVINLPKRSIVCEDFEKFYSSHIKGDSNKHSKNLRSNSSKQDIFEDFYAKNFTDENFSSDKIKFRGCKDLKVHLTKELIKVSSKEDVFESFYESNVNLNQSKNDAFNKDKEVQKTVNCKDLRIEMHDLSNPNYKETVFENFFTRNINLTTHTDSSLGEDEENIIKCKDLKVNITNLDFSANNINHRDCSIQNKEQLKNSTKCKDLRLDVKQLSEKNTEVDSFEHFYAQNLNIINSKVNSLDVKGTIKETTEYMNLAVDMQSNREVNLKGNKDTSSNDKGKKLIDKDLQNSVRKLSRINSEEDIFESFYKNNLNLIQQNNCSSVKIKRHNQQILKTKILKNNSNILQNLFVHNINPVKILKVHLIRNDYQSIINDSLCRSNENITKIYSKEGISYNACTTNLNLMQLKDCSPDINENNALLNRESLTSDLDDNTSGKSSINNFDLKKVLTVHLERNDYTSIINTTPLKYNEEITNSEIISESMEVDIFQTEQFETFYKDNYDTYDVLPTSTVEAAVEKQNDSDTNIIESSLPEIYVQNGKAWKHAIRPKIVDSSKANLISSEVDCVNNKNVSKLSSDINTCTERRGRPKRTSESCDNAQLVSKIITNINEDPSNNTHKIENQNNRGPDKKNHDSELVFNNVNQVDPQSSTARFEISENIQLTSEAVYNSIYTEAIFEMSEVQIDLSSNDSNTTQMFINKKQQSKSPSKLLNKDLDNNIAKISQPNAEENKNLELTDESGLGNCLNDDTTGNNTEIDGNLNVSTTDSNGNSSVKRRGRPKRKLKSNSKKERVVNVITSLLHVTAENSVNSFDYHDTGKISILEKGDEIQTDLKISEVNIQASSNNFSHSEVKLESSRTRRGRPKSKVNSNSKKASNQINSHVIAEIVSKPDESEKTDGLETKSTNKMIDMKSPEENTASSNDTRISFRNMRRGGRTSKKVHSDTEIFFKTDAVRHETILEDENTNKLKYGLMLPDVNVKSSLSNENILNTEEKLPKKQRGKLRQVLPIKDSDLTATPSLNKVEGKHYVMTKSLANSDEIDKNMVKSSEKRRGRPRKNSDKIAAKLPTLILKTNEDILVAAETADRSNGLEKSFESDLKGNVKTRKNKVELKTSKKSLVDIDIESKSPKKQRTRTKTELEINNTNKTARQSPRLRANTEEYIHVTAETSDIITSELSLEMNATIDTSVKTLDSVHSSDTKAKYLKQTTEKKIEPATSKSTSKYMTRSVKLFKSNTDTMCAKTSLQKHLNVSGDSKFLSLRKNNEFKAKAKRKNQGSNLKSISKIIADISSTNKINVKSKGRGKSNILVEKLPAELVNKKTISSNNGPDIPRSKLPVLNSSESHERNLSEKVNQEILNISSSSERLSLSTTESSKLGPLSKKSNIFTDKMIQKRVDIPIDSTTKASLDLGVDKDGFKMPKINKSPKNILLKAGKSWRRSLSLHKRSSLFFGFRKEDSGSPFSGKTCPKGKLSRLPSQKCPRRLSVRFVPVKPLPVLQTETDCSILEEYAVNTSYVPDQILEASLEDSFRCLSLNQSQRRNSVNKSHLVVPVTAREIVLRKCGQTEPIQFSKCFPDSTLQNCQKIGEGVYGEVFLFRNPNGGTSVLKIVPVEGDQIVNGERQKKFEEVLSEIIITIELSNLRNNKRNGISAFTEVQKIQCVQGRYPEKLLDLWDLFDETRGSENDCPDVFGDEQLYIVFQMAYGGRDLESFIFNSAMQAYSMFQQVALALAIAEEELHFEHRDLHWGNVLVSAVEANKITSFNLENKTYEIPTMGVEVAIIDYTLSRIEHDGVVIFNDLGLDPDLFTAEGDYQFEVYRLMQQKNRNNWKEFEPFSNLLWLHYVLDKAIAALRYRHLKTKRHREYLRKLKMLKEDILSYSNVKDFVVANLLGI